ncbi:cysteine sulfinic acid decarboxylase-like [Pecten maximus]|uniref:cysteine sulfinic acid decarboxylase-like n=1 Tax=Pecten maximus TaxID=6579 RepID=UPI001458FE41|nr:cysteine sulfinic acid decarboxylase-like [Pecten maximus]
MHEGTGEDQTKGSPRFLRRLVEDIFKDVFARSSDKNIKVTEFKFPADLESIMDLTLEEPTDDSRLLEICQDVIKYSVRTDNPLFFNQLFGGMDQYTMGGAWLTDALNTSRFTYEVAPVFTIMEKYVINKMLEVAGLSSGDGIFCPGGSISNMYGLNLARCRRFPEVKMDGMSSLPPLRILASEQAHYSVRKAAAFLGFGMKSVIPVKCDTRGRMLTLDLEQNITALKAKGEEPLCVVATSGTTVLGAFDPLNEIANICDKYKLWMHVDSAWGGAVLLSKKHRGLMSGIGRADSLTWNPHKMMGALNQCSVFLTRHKDLLEKSHCARAEYLFQQDKFYDVTYDTGDKSIQCGRKVDVLKLWVMWKSKGDKRLEDDVDNALDCAKHMASMVTDKVGFRLLIQPEFTNICFWYIPPSMRNEEEDDDWKMRLSKVAPAIKKQMMMEGTMMVAYQPLGDHVNFFRLVLSNLDIKSEDMNLVVNIIDRIGQGIYNEKQSLPQAE